MPQLWDTSIEAHRHGVRDAIMDATGGLVSLLGLRGVTMSRIAEEAGIGRATLYKYLPDIETVLIAWHERQVNRHLEHLAEVQDQGGDAGDRLRAVLEAFARISHEHDKGEIAVLLHHGEHVTRAQQRLTDMVRELIAEAARGGNVRADVPPEQLATYCLHALMAGAELPSRAAADRLAAVVLAGLQSPR